MDWNQASIDSNQVCREGEKPGDYVQWTPMELAYLHDWNVIYVPQGMDFQQILAAQRLAVRIKNSQPTAIVYRTTKGWQYGIEGKGSHGAGHGLCSNGFFTAVQPLMESAGMTLPRCEGEQRCKAGQKSDVLEECLWEALSAVRAVIERSPDLVKAMAKRTVQARDRLNRKKRQPRKNAPQVDAIYRTAEKEGHEIPEALKLVPGKSDHPQRRTGPGSGVLQQSQPGGHFRRLGRPARIHKREHRSQRFS